MIHRVQRDRFAHGAMLVCADPKRSVEDILVLSESPKPVRLNGGERSCRDVLSAKKRSWKLILWTRARTFAVAEFVEELGIVLRR